MLGVANEGGRQVTSGDKVAEPEVTERRMSEATCALSSHSPDPSEKPPTPRVLTFPSRPRRQIPIEKPEAHPAETESDEERTIDSERRAEFFAARSHRRQSSVVGGKDWRDLDSSEGEV